MCGKWFFATAAVIGIAAVYARAATPPIVTLDDLGPNGSSAYPVNGPNTPTLVGFDIHVELFPLDPNDYDANGDGWDTFQAGVLQGSIMNAGSTFVYPPEPWPAPLPPGGRVTFVNLPCQNQDPDGPRGQWPYYVNQPAQEPQWVDLKYFPGPDGFAGDLGGGWTMRAVIDMAGSSVPPDLVYASLDEPVGPIIIAQGIIQVGTENFQPSTQQYDWFISAIPEPASAVLLLLVGLVVTRGR